MKRSTLYRRSMNATDVTKGLLQAHNSKYISTIIIQIILLSNVLCATLTQELKLFLCCTWSLTAQQTRQITAGTEEHMKGQYANGSYKEGVALESSAGTAMK